jgi:hypothetical protein
VDRILVAPITVSPTKPLTPTHLNYLLSIDMLGRATAAIADVTCVYDHLAFADGHQTVAFWEYLDRVWAGTDFRRADERWIGELYKRHHAEPAPAPARRLRPYIERVQEQRWMHPSAVRVLEIWQSHYQTLNLAGPHTAGPMAPRLPDSVLIDELVGADLCIDGRPLGAPVYLDLTAQGIALRALVSADGQANYLVCVLGQLLPMVGEYDLTVLMYDRAMRDDYVMIERVLRVFGARTARVEVSRVPIGGVAVSSRHGGWEDYLLPEVRTAAGGADAEFQLGARLYLSAVFGRGSQHSFTVAELSRWVARARRLLDAPAAGGDPVDFLRGLARGAGYVDPYRLTSRLLGKDQKIPVRTLIENVYCPSPRPAVTPGRTRRMASTAASAAASVQ